MPDWDRIGTIALGDDVTVGRVGFGGVRLTGPGTFGPPPDLDAARRTGRRAREAGVQLFDTADCYGPEISERLRRGPAPLRRRRGHRDQGRAPRARRRALAGGGPA